MGIKAVSKVLGWFDRNIIENEMKKVIAMFDLHGNIIDYGCGQMRYKNMFTDSEMVGADIENPTMPSVATVKIKDYKTNLPKHSFDIGICTEVIEHTENPSMVLKELNRLIKPCGYLILTAPFMIPEHDERDYWRFTLKGLKILASENGFETIYEKKLTKNIHSISHMTRNVVWLSLVRKGKSKYITAPIVLPFVMLIGGLLALFNRLSSLDTGPISCMIVCRKRQ